MKRSAGIVAHFGLLTTLALVLGLMDRALPISALLSGGVPGLKLGLSNTVLLYAVYLLDWKTSALLMVAKVILSGFIFGSLSAILYSFSGGALSLAVMLLAKKNAKVAAFGAGIIAWAGNAFLIFRNHTPQGPLLLCVILIGVAGTASFALFFLLRRHPDWSIVGVSLAGAVAHNLGQILMASQILRTPALLYTYLPVLAGLGAAVGCLTGIIAQRMLHALKKQ